MARLHLDYEKLEPWPLTFVCDDEERLAGASDSEKRRRLSLSYRMEKMKLNKDNTALKVNESLTLTGIRRRCLNIGWVTAARSIG